MQRDFLILQGSRLASPRSSLLKLVEQIQTPYVPGIESVKNKEDFADDELKLKETREIQEMIDSNDLLRSQRQRIQSLVRMLKESEQRNEDLREQNRRQKEQLRELHETKLKYDVLQPRFRALELKFKNLLQEKQYIQARLKSLEGQGMDKTIYELRGTISRLQATIEALEVDNEKLQKSLHFLKIERQDNAKAFAVENQQNKIQIKTLRCDLEKLAHENGHLEFRIKQLLEAEQNQGGEMQHLEKEYNTLKLQLDSCKRELELSQERVLTLQQMNNKSKLEGHKAVLQANAQIERVVIQLNRTRSQLQKQRIQDKQRCSQLHLLEEDHKALLKQNQNLQTIIRNLSTELQHLKETKGSSDGLVNYLKMENDGLKEKLKKIEEWRLVDRQHRQDTQLLRYNALCEKEKELRRIEQLLRWGERKN